MMIIVCPYSFGFSSSWVTDCDTAVARSEFVTEVGTTRAALRRLLDHAAPLMGVRYSLPQYGRIKSHDLAPIEGKEKPADRTILSSGYAEPAVARWVDVHLRLIQPPRAGHSKGAPSWGAFSLAAPRRETPPGHGLPNGVPIFRGRNAAPTKKWPVQVKRPSPAASLIEVGEKGLSPNRSSAFRLFAFTLSGTDT